MVAARPCVGIAQQRNQTPADEGIAPQMFVRANVTLPEFDESRWLRPDASAAPANNSLARRSSLAAWKTTSICPRGSGAPAGKPSFLFPNHASNQLRQERNLCSHDPIKTQAPLGRNMPLLDGAAELHQALPPPPRMIFIWRCFQTPTWPATVSAARILADSIRGRISIALCRTSSPDLRAASF